MNGQSIDALGKKVQSMKDRFEKVEKDVRNLKDLLNTHDNWHSTIHEWIGEGVIISDRSGHLCRGILKWSDRYNLCIAHSTDPKPITRMYTKGGINWIEKE